MGIDELLGGKRDQILRVAARHGARHVRVFGSVARGEADESSEDSPTWQPTCTVKPASRARRQRAADATRPPHFDTRTLTAVHALASIKRSRDNAS